MLESYKPSENGESVLYSLSGIIIDIGDRYIKASIRDGMGRRTVIIRDKAAFEKAGILGMGDPFLYHICRANEVVYGKVTSRDAESDEKPAEIEHEISELLKRLEEKEAEAFKRIITINVR